MRNNISDRLENYLLCISIGLCAGSLGTAWVMEGLLKVCNG